MNIVFLTSRAQHHYYLINAINNYYPIKKAFFQTAHISHRTWHNQLKKFSKPQRLASRLLARLLFDNEKSLAERYENKMFFNDVTPFLNSAIPSEEIFSFNGAETVAKVKKENPDLIIVFGTEVLKGEILDIAKLNILNIHRDILPKYRGSGFPFWIFLNNDFQNLGVTVHVCARELDAGAIVGQKYYKLQRNDKIYTLRYKTTLLAVDVLKEVIDKYQNGIIEYTKQQAAPTWTAKNLTLLKEIQARRNFNKYLRTLKKPTTVDQRLPSPR